MSATKKCPHCGQWTEWLQQPTDLCQHCGQVLEPYRVASNEARQQLADEPISPLLLIEIKPDDNAVVKLFKYLIRGGQLAFAAFISFMLWLAAAAAG